ncbi:heme biosynthesis HemY N-terminal domain-containing protein [Rubrivivax gelatinosus]|uniref:Putative protoporphyrinogen IX and coproporphyrinogen III oxidase HemY n=1 Tax=Rubrivivax gelatinosus (strain NBRC 100245 / IL144) TaxID=983917 RepID=I0HVE6_RUBGI|nr:heme biosynthesis HemY N-terminal domain-containing protein [Rubrivivax gelatinosus]MBG6078914.1 HemY protein [Rubrivivax gelatinosus]BAL96983.1 putative protoporphyrinogen IX and coproporphyrinogen III oxidase HemY [Rubrivivax gelatinosus IL144]
MRIVIWLILLCVVAVVAATTLGSNDGIVTIYWRGWRTDLSLNLFVLIVVAGAFAITSAVQAINALVTLPKRAGEWRALRRERAAQAALREALSEYFSARYSRAHKAATRAIAIQQDSNGLTSDAEFSVLAHLLAAGSLHRLQDRTRRDELLKRLPSAGRKGGVGSGRSADDGARLLAAEWALDDRDASKALELLAELPPGVARRTQALRLKLQACRQARRPLEALHTARLLAKHQGFSPVAAQGLLRSLAFEALETVHDLQQLRLLWDELDPADRRDPMVVARAARRAAVLGACEVGRDWLRPFWERAGELSREEREELALALMDCVAGIGSDWLPRLEETASSHAHEPAVVAAVGMAYAERQLWGKARRLLELAAAAPALSSLVRRRCWRLLARLAREESDEDRARDCENFAAGLD